MNRLFFACVPVVLIGCGIVQEFGTSKDGPKTDGGAESDAGSPPLPDGDASAAPAPTFSWLNPLPTGNDLLGIWGTADDDVWLAGSHGTIARWDGAKASLVYDGKADEEFYAMWGSGKDDMWIGGRAGAGGRLLHWDGQSLSSPYSLDQRSIHALWGTSSNSVWALADRDVLYFDGTRFHVSGLCDLSMPTTDLLRDLWGSSASDLWAVGDGGSIYRYQNRSGVGDCWGRETNSKTGLADPFARDHAYFGVWGSSANDVWAAFIEPATSSRRTWRVGFSHFDGTAWRVTQLENLPFVVPAITTEPTRRGHQVWGRSANDILAVVGTSAWRWNGTTWTSSTVDSRYTPAATWGSANRGVMAVGPAGTWRSLEADQSWTQVIPTMREHLTDVSVAPDGSAWAHYGDQSYQGEAHGIVRWTESGWAVVPPPLPLASFKFAALKALSKDDLWVAGTRYGSGGFVARFTNGAWGAIQHVPIDDVRAIDVASPTNAWVVGDKAAARWDGTAWRAIPMPADVGAPVLTGVHIAGDDVWISGSAGGSGDGIVLRWDGTRLQTSHRSRNNGYYGIWASGPNDIWVTGDPAVLHYDGSTWAPIGELDFWTDRIWGSGPDDVWLAPRRYVLNGRGAIRHWDGTTLSTVLEVTSPLVSVAGRA
ncbi:MAG: uncharacterized protein K0S65_2081, partial [Labilithrix sp.]|nr:uncharacterized protein [Labilithrix sp.]